MTASKPECNCCVKELPGVLTIHMPFCPAHDEATCEGCERYFGNKQPFLQNRDTGDESEQSSNSNK